MGMSRHLSRRLGMPSIERPTLLRQFAQKRVSKKAFARLASMVRESLWMRDRSSCSGILTGLNKQRQRRAFAQCWLRGESSRPTRPSKPRVLLNSDHGGLIVVDLSRRLVPVGDWRRLIDVIDWRSWVDVSLWWCLIIHFGRLWDGTFCRNVAGTS